MITVPLYSGGDIIETACAAVNVWAALSGIAGITLYSLSVGLPLRGGLDIGLGVDVFPNEVYGPVLVNAYHLESKLADYPRTLVGANVGKYLTELEGLPRENPAGQFAAKYAADCRKLICMAPDDGRTMLHFLSPHLAAVSPLFGDRRSPARAWVATQRAKYRESGNLMLAGRYERLERYFATYLL